MDDDTRHRLSKLRSECGCRAGAITMLLFLGAYALSMMWMAPTPHTRREQLVLIGCIALAGALTGKALGVLWARYRYWVLVRRHESRI
jgi:hypothetical protein